MPKGSSKSRRSLRRARYLANDIAPSSQNPTAHRSSPDTTAVGYNDGNPPIGRMNDGFVQDAYPRTRSSSNRGHAESPHLPDDYSLPVAFNDLTVIGRNNNINPATWFQTVANFGVANVATQSTVVDSIETDFDFEITSPIVSDIGDFDVANVATQSTVADSNYVPYCLWYWWSLFSWCCAFHRTW